MSEIIDAEALQKKKAMTRWNIREVPIRESPCDELCQRWSDCPGESWACPKYQKFRSE